LAPENIVYLLYELLDFEEHRKCHPNFYGEYLGEFITPAYAKRWLRDHERYGAFAIVERVNGKIGKSWPHEIDPPDAGIDQDLSDDGFELLDEDEFSDNPVTSLRIKNAKLSAKLEAASQNGAHGSMNQLLQGLRALDEMRGESAPQKSLAEQLREVREVNEIINPRREVNSAPAPPLVDPKVSALKIIAENPNMIEIAKDVFGLKRESDSDPWADAFNKLLDHPQLPQIAGAIFTPLAGGLGNLFTSIASLLAPRQPQAPTNPDQGAQVAQQAPAVQPQQAPPQVAAAEAQALPEAAQQPQATQPQIEQEPMQMAPVDALVYSLIAAMEKQAPIADAQNLINIAIVRNPELGDSVDEILNLPVDQILRMLAAYHPPVAQMAHAREWLQSLVNSLSAEGDDDFDQFTEVDTRKDETKL